MTLAELTYYAFLLRNDLHHIHLHAAGPQFDKVHAITDELYNEAQDEVDSLAEMAISEGDEVKSFSDVRAVVDESEWPTLEGEAWDMDLFVKDFAEIGKRYLDAIEDCDCNDIHRSALDEIALFWDKEVNFFNAARQIGCENPDVEGTTDEEDLVDDLTDPDDAYTYIDAMQDAELTDSDTDVGDDLGLQSMTTDMLVTGYNPVDEKYASEGNEDEDVKSEDTEEVEENMKKDEE